MLLGILVPLAVIAAIVVAAVLFFQRGGGLDTSPRALLRAYLYLGSLVSLLVAIYGFSLLGTALLGAVAPDFTFGAPPVRVVAPPNGTAPVPPIIETGEDQHRRQTADDLIQGGTMAVAGALFFLVHWWGRGQLESSAERGNALRRAYFLLGVVIFGVSSIVLLPTAAYNALRWFLLPVGPGQYRPGVGENLAGAIVVVIAWLVFLRVVLAEYRASRTEARA